MTAAERQQRRARLAIGGPRLRAFRPWDGTFAGSYAETNAINRIENWLIYGDVEPVTEWLARCIGSRDDIDELFYRLGQMTVYENREAGDP
jgi:hypothetical protein